MSPFRGSTQEQHALGGAGFLRMLDAAATNAPTALFLCIDRTNFILTKPRTATRGGAGGKRELIAAWRQGRPGPARDTAWPAAGAAPERPATSRRQRMEAGGPCYIAAPLVTAPSSSTSASGRRPADLESSSRGRSPLLRRLLISLAIGAFGLATIVPGVFTVDENHHLVALEALRDGRQTISGTEHLTASTELLWFDPQGRYRETVRVPIAPTIPPLYALIALPFSVFGWYGLVALNIAGFLATGWLVFAYVRRYAESRDAPWLAAAAFWLGGYAVEYAQGLWPHMLAAALTTAAAYLAARVRDGGPLLAAFLAGWLAGLAGGIRYQNVFFAGCIGIGILALGQRRARALAAFGAGLSLPLAAAAILNWLRLGSANPASKGDRYLEILDAPRQQNLVADALRMAWARIIDYSTRPPLGGEHLSYLARETSTGAYLVDWTVKKAWLQSAPWIAIALCVLAASWLRRSGDRADARRELRALSLVVFPVLAMFAVAGVKRTDGLGYNQRYFIELVPLAAIAFALALDRARADRRDLLTGAFAGAAVSWVWLTLTLAYEARFLSVLRIPIALAAATSIAWLVSIRRPALGRGWFGALAGAAVAWALVVHLMDDLPASRARRHRNLETTHLLDQVLPRAPDRSALFVWWGTKNGVGPLLFERDLLVVEARTDEGRSMSTLLDELLHDGRKSFVVANGFPKEVLSSALAGRATLQRGNRSLMLLEIVAEPSPGSEEVRIQR